MKKTSLSPVNIRQLLRRHEVLRRKLGGVECLSQGSVMRQPPGAWRWTRKVDGKTVSRGLSETQAALMARAIANQRALDDIIDEMRAITQKLILEASRLPGTSSPQKHPKMALS